MAATMAGTQECTCVCVCVCVCMFACVLRAARFTLPPPPSASLFQAQAVQECAHVQLRTSVDKNTRRHNVSLGTRATVVISLGLYSLARSLVE